MIKLRFADPIATNKGPTSAQEQLQASQTAFYNELTKDYKTQFANQQAVLGAVTAAWGPVIAAGINQYGFSAAEDTALRSLATEGTGIAYKQGAQAVNEEIAAQGGGNTFLPSGAQNQLREQVATAASRQQSAEQLQITQAGYEAGRQDFLAGTQAEETAAGLYNPAGFAGAANQGGAAASQTASDIAQESGGFWSTVGGILGGAVSGAATGGFGAGGAFTKMLNPGCWIAEAIYGVDAWQTHLLRSWLNREFKQSKVGNFVMKLYLKYGQQIAAQVRKHAWLRMLIKPVFDHALKKALRDRLPQTEIYAC